jgi:hypothetical protein
MPRGLPRFDSPLSGTTIDPLISQHKAKTVNAPKMRRGFGSPRADTVQSQHHERHVRSGRMTGVSEAPVRRQINFSSTKGVAGPLIEPAARHLQTTTVSITAAANFREMEDSAISGSFAEKSSQLLSAPLPRVIERPAQEHR